MRAQRSSRCGWRSAQAGAVAEPADAEPAERTEAGRVQQAREAAALAAVQQAQARLDQAKLNLGYTKITAPIDGIVSKKKVAVGANLSVGQSIC